MPRRTTVRSRILLLTTLCLATGLPAPAALGDGPGQKDLDRATELKVAAEGLRDLDEVINLLESSLEAGLDDENTEFAEAMLVGTLMQRAGVRAQAVLDRTKPGQPSDARLVRIWQLALTDLQRVVELDASLAEAHFLIGRLQSLPQGDRNAARRALTKVIKSDSEEVTPEMRAEAYALRAARQTDPDRQRADFAEAIKLFPEKPEFYLLRARASSEAGDHDAALADFAKAIELEPSKPEHYLLRAGAHIKLGDPEAAIADFGKASELEPDKIEYHLFAIRALIANENLEAALEQIERAIAVAPDNATIYEQKGLVLSAQEKHEEALAAFDKAAELAPRSPAPPLYRSEIYRILKQYDKAIEQITQAIQLAPQNLLTVMRRAELYSTAKRYEEALADVELVLRRQPTLWRAHLMQAALLDRLGRSDEAIAALEQVAAAAPGQPEVQLQLAGYYMSNGRYADAIELLTRVIDATEETMQLLRLRGDAFLSVGKHREALADFARGYELDAEDHGLLNNYAWTLATTPYDELRDGARAVELATQACELTEFKEAYILSTLAAAYAESGDFDKAIEWSQKAVEAHAGDSEKSRDMSAELSAELASYRAGEPWRELKQDEGQPQSDGVDDDANGSAPPVQTLDF